MITFLICLTLVLTGVYIVYNKGKRPLAKLSGLLEEKRLVNFSYTTTTFKGYSVHMRGTYLELKIKIDQVEDPYGPDYMNQTVQVIVPKEEVDLIKEGSRIDLTLKRFISPNSKKTDDIYRTSDGASFYLSSLADR